MRKFFATVTATGAILFCAVPMAQAQTTTLQPGPGQYTFDGMAELTASGFSPNCNLELTGDVATNNDGSVTIDVVDGNVTGSGLCGVISLDFNPAWTVTVPQEELPTTENPTRPVVGTFQNVQVSYSFLGFPIQCSSTPAMVEATFMNGASGVASSFTFNDDIGSRCAVDGTIDAQQDIDVLVTGS